MTPGELRAAGRSRTRLMRAGGLARAAQARSPPQHGQQRGRTEVVGGYLSVEVACRLSALAVENNVARDCFHPGRVAERWLRVSSERAAARRRAGERRQGRYCHVLELHWYCCGAW